MELVGPFPAPRLGYWGWSYEMYAYLVYQKIGRRKVEKVFIGDSISELEQLFKVRVIAYLGLAANVGG